MEEVVGCGMATTTSYPSDVSDEEWAVAVPYLTLLAPSALQRKYDLRTVFNAVRYLAHTGAPWRYLPSDFPPWPVVYQQVRRWPRPCHLERRWTIAAP